MSRIVRILAMLSLAAGIVARAAPGEAQANGAPDLTAIAFLRAPFHAAAKPREGPVSYRFALTSEGAGTFSGILNEQPFRMQLDGPDGRTMMYTSGAMVYSNDRAGRWTRYDSKRLEAAWSNFGPVPAPPVSSRTSTPPQTELPDRRVNGVVLGAFRYTSTLHGSRARTAGRSRVTVTCLYEKATGDVRSCTAGSLFSIHYSHYDDPANAIVIPPEALHAEDITEQLIAETSEAAQRLKASNSAKK